MKVLGYRFLMLWVRNQGVYVNKSIIISTELCNFNKCYVFRNKLVLVKLLNTIKVQFRQFRQYSLCYSDVMKI